MRTTKNISLTIPPVLLKQATAIAKQEGRTQSELFREALRRYIIQSGFQRLQQAAITRNKKRGLSENDVAKLIKAYRTEQNKKK